MVTEPSESASDCGQSQNQVTPGVYYPPSDRLNYETKVRKREWPGTNWGRGLRLWYETGAGHGLLWGKGDYETKVPKRRRARIDVCAGEKGHETKATVTRQSLYGYEKGSGQGYIRQNCFVRSYHVKFSLWREKGAGL